MHKKTMNTEWIRQLKDIEYQLEIMRRTMETESREAKLELQDRLNNHLTGQAAIDHYNNWMKRAGLDHLCVI